MNFQPQLFRNKLMGKPLGGWVKTGGRTSQANSLGEEDDLIADWNNA